LQITDPADSLTTMQLAQYVIDKVNGMDVDIDGKETEENAADGKPSLVALKA